MYTAGRARRRGSRPRASGVEHHDVAPQRHHVLCHPMRVVEQAIDDAPGARFERDALENEPQLLWGMQQLDLGSPLQAA